VLYYYYYLPPLPLPEEEIGIREVKMKIIGVNKIKKNEKKK